MKLAKNLGKYKQHPEAKIICFPYPCYHPKTMGDILKNVQKNSTAEVIWLMAMKMRLKMKCRSYRYDVNTGRPRHGHK